MLFESKHVKPDRFVELEEVSRAFYEGIGTHFESEWKHVVQADSCAKVHICVEKYFRNNNTLEQRHLPFGRVLCAHAAIVWVSDEFSDFAIDYKHSPILLSDFYDRTGYSPILTYNQITASQSSQGLNLFVVFWHWNPNILDENEFHIVESLLRNRLLLELQGWNIKQCLMEIFSHYHDWCVAFGLKQVAPPRKDLLVETRLMGATRIDLSSENRLSPSWDILREQPANKLNLSEKEKRVALLLMRGLSRADTDDHLLTSIGRRMSTINERQNKQKEMHRCINSIRVKVNKVARILDTDEWTDARLIQFLRDNMHELRPTSPRKYRHQ